MKLAQKMTRIIRLIRRDGIKYRLVRMLLKVFREPNEIQRAKQLVLDELLNKHDATVTYGPFSGMKLSTNVWWGKFDLISKMLGVYEEPVLAKLCGLKVKSDALFIDIGAADGYFAVGMAFSKRFKSVYAFEISEKGRENLHANAKSNCCDGLLTIKGEANYLSLKEILGDKEGAVVLIDIEGAEFDLLSTQMLQLLRKCHVICELHPMLVDRGIEKQKILIDNSKSLFNVSIIQRDFYNPNQFEELADFTDDQRLLAFSEGRGKNMEWLVLEPKD